MGRRRGGLGHFQADYFSIDVITVWSTYQPGRIEMEEWLSVHRYELFIQTLQ
jgi:hypothetical protein